MLPSLPRLLRGDFNRRAETTRFYADKGQSADFVSYVAIQNRIGLWDVYFCNYLPERNTTRRDLVFEGESTPISAYGEAEAPYRATLLRSWRDGRNMRLSSALAELQAREDMWRERHAVPEERANVHSRHFSLRQTTPRNK